MKTIHLTNAWHASSGGIATHYRSLLAEAERVGREMVMVVPGERDRVEHSGSVRIHTVKAGPSPLNPAYRSIMPNSWPGVNRRVVEVLLAEQPDLIEICDKYSLHYLAGLIRKEYLKGFAKRPVLIGLSCERMDDNLGVYLTRSPMGKAFARWYMKWIYFGFFDHHVTNSEHVAGELREAARGHITERGIYVRPPGVDLSQFAPGHRNAETRQKLLAAAGGTPESRLVLYAGRLAPEKNLSLLMDSFALLCRDEAHDWRLAVAGDGMLREDLEREAAARFAGRALFLGHLQGRRELASVCANCDVFVHTNPAEPFGIAPLEAMASGVPLVGPNSGGILTYANDRNAWIVKPEASAFESAITKCFVGEDRERRIREGLETARRFHAPDTAGRFLEMYEQFVLNGSAPEPDYVSTPGTWLGSEV